MPTKFDKRAGRIRHRTEKIRTRVRRTRGELERIARTTTLGGVFLSFLKIGFVGFGGGLAVIAQMRTLAVQKRRWVSDPEFAAAFALAQSLPGTSSGNTATYLGLKLRGWRGASVAISGFILPSMLMMVVLAILYRHLRYLPDTDSLFHGLNAAVVAVVAVTAWRMGQHTFNKRWQWWIAILACLVVTLFSATVIEVVLAAGIAGIFIDSYTEKRLPRLELLRGIATRRRKRITARITLERRRRRIRGRAFIGGYLMRAIADQNVKRAAQENNAGAQASLPARTVAPESAGKDACAPRHADTSKTILRSSVLLAISMPILAKAGLLVVLATIFLRMGSITFGGGLVMIPLIEAEVVHSHHWLTHQQFADATALGQVTPGPVLITATFIGYYVAGTLGALVATIAVFLPSFLMTIAAGSSLRAFQKNILLQAFLKGVTPAVVGLLVAAAVSIGRAGIHTWIGLTIMIGAMIVLIRFRPNAFWVIIGAGLIRFVIGFVLR